MLPNSIPPVDITKVVAPIASAMTTMSTSSSASDTPTAIASMLVPIAVTIRQSSEPRPGSPHSPSAGLRNASSYNFV